MNDRGQTTQDYAVGISILLLTVVGVFIFVPTVFQVSETPVDRNEHTQAQELADSVIEEYRVGGTTNTLAYQRLSEVTGEQELPGALKDDAGVWLRNANVTIVEQRRVGDVYDDPTFTAGSWVYDDEPTATVTRIVQFEDGDRCGSDGTCRLIVRVW
ncbi:hypothetical protein GJ629_04345 [Halapricum sp. CBA1109]|uniref:DUF7287 family protein n=1 Tax=Halapricum sp. CBA1109 TaxID=2668068 RepID=UPI0012F84BDD|nr:hypothetical protein [Halapricum sp. CBA1109]MUV89221.1 hypothetical protein [Halapricum sp. CBA1109]